MNYDNLNRICNKYGFKWDIIGNNIRIKSKHDEWMFLDYESNNGIKLYHFNRRGGSGTHYQGKFNSMKNIIEYINEHDKKMFYSFNKVFRLDKTFKLINGRCL